MISSDSMRGFNDLLILHLLSLRDSYGYALSKAIAELSDQEYIIKETTLYSAIARLEQNGCVRGYDGLETHGRARSYYALTAKGKQLLAEKRREWEAIQTVITKVLEEK